MDDQLQDQPTDRPARKVQAATSGAGLGALVGGVIAMWTFAYLPADLQEVPGAMEAWVGLVGLAIASGTAFVTGYQARERAENMIVQP